MTTPSRDKLLRMDGWPGGINNRIRETEQSVPRSDEAIPSSQFLRSALNVDLSAEGTPLRRKGRTELATGWTHSLWASDRLNVFCCVADGTLYASTEADYANTAFASVSVNRYLTMSYCAINTSVYWSNGAELGVFDAQSRTVKTWGIPVAPKPVVSPGPSENSKGWEDSRQVSVVYVDQYGTEGGASEPVLATGAGTFTVTVPMPLPNDVVKANIYVSEVGGEILYLTETLSTLTTATIYVGNIGKGKQIDTLNMEPPKAGQLLAAGHGRVYIARNAQISFTEPLRYNLTRPSQGIYTFSDYVTMMQPVDDGLYVGTKTGVVFIAGTDPYDVTQKHVSSYAPVEGASMQISGEQVGVPLDTVPVWWGTGRGLVVGLPGGQLKELTEDRYTLPKYAAGAMSLREQEGMTHIISSLRSSDGLNKMGATDTVVASVRTNNIILNN